jgi:hypothetical protein
VYVELSLYLILTVYEVITDPPVSYMIQEIRTLVPLMAVVGAKGVVGRVAAMIAISLDIAL